MTSFTRTLRAAATAGILAGSCTVTACGDEPLISPDEAGCTRGTIAVGRPEAGRVDDASCIAISVRDSSLVLTESWTLHAERGRAYIVRMNPLGEYAELDLVAVTRDATGAPALATAHAHAYSEPGEPEDDMPSQEMLLASYRDQDVALRLESPAYDNYSTWNNYTISVMSCPIRDLPSAGEVGGIALIDGCLSYSFGFNGFEAKVTFLGFKGRAGRSYEAQAQSETSAGPMFGLVAGPDLDVTADLPGSIRYGVGPSEVLNRVIPIERDGRYTFMVSADRETDLVVQASVAPIPLVAPPLGTPRSP